MAKNLKEKKHTLFASFKCAFRGVGEAWISEKSLRIHFYLAFLVIILGFIFQISRTEWLFITMIIALVLTTEMVNTAVEKILDLVCKEANGEVRFIKDLFAAIVLIAALGSLIIGAIIFIPKIAVLF